MALDVNPAIRCTWAALAIVWIIGLAFTKRTVRSQPTSARMFHLALILLGFSMIGTEWIRGGWLSMRFAPVADWVEIAGLALTVAGCLFAIWARLTLGSNWSGKATVKAGHELVASGPYALARHPIYTGMVLGAAGTALAGGEWRCVVGVALILLAVMVKMNMEERLMMQTFPDQYPEYRRRVKALIPGVF
jgi:protein-S-isoprenylcysteine O-methyltransferase Ste14